MPDVRVIKRDPVTGRIEFEIQNDYVEGIDFLVQLVALDLMASPGTDILDKDIGSGIPDLIGMNMDPDNPAEIEAELIQRISQTRDRILIDQIESSAPAEERLRSVELVNITPYPDEGRVDIRIRVENEVGRTTSVVL